MMVVRSSSIAETITATVAALAFIYFFRGVLIPLVLALFLAVLVHALVGFVGSRLGAVPSWLVMAVVALIVIAGAATVFFIIGQGAANLTHEAPRLLERIEQLVLQAGHAVGLSKPLQLATIMGDISVPQFAGSAAAGLGGLLSAVILVITYFGFIMVGRPRVRQRLARLSPSRGNSKRLEIAVERIAADIQTYLWVQTVTGMMIAGASGAVMFAVGLDNALFWTVVLFLLSYIPMIGVTLGSVTPAVFALLQFPSWWPAVVIFAAIQIAATIVGNLVYPRMQAQSQNIDPVATLFAIAFWGFLWGITGAFLAVPLTLIAMMICGQFPRMRWVPILLSYDGQPPSPQDN